MLDHTAIYLLIAGTYTPIALAVIAGTKGWVLFGVIWGLAAFGVVVTLVGFKRAKWVEMALYLTMGWLVVNLWQRLGGDDGPCTAVAAVCRRADLHDSLVFYAWKRLPFNHMVWHLFVARRVPSCISWRSFLP